MKLKLTLWLMALMLAVIIPGTSLAADGDGKAVELVVEPTEEEQAAHDKKVAEAHELAIGWVTSIIAKVAPPGRKTYYVEAQETKEDAEDRHRSLATDLIEVVFARDTRTIFSGRTGRSRTATLMMGIMLHESGFARNVDYGVGKFARGDNGASWCLMQMNVGKGRTWKHAGGWNIKHHRPWRYGDPKEEIVEGASGPEMVKDRRKCFTEGLRLIRISFRSCYRNTFKERLAVYASGRCTAGQKGSRLRINSGIKMYVQSKTERTFEDKHLIEAVDNILKVRTLKEAAEKALAEKKKAADDLKAAEKAKDAADKPTAKLEGATTGRSAAIAAKSR